MHCDGIKGLVDGRRGLQAQLLRAWVGVAEPNASVSETSAQPTPKKRKRRLWLKIPIYLMLFVVVLIACVRPFMPRMVRWYVNRTLNQSQIYHGKIGDVDLHLWKGAYAIHDVRLIKMTGDVPVPLFDAKEVDFSVEWKNLIHGKVVGRFALQEPQLNFVAAKSDAESETGAGGPWLQIIQDLFPFDINSAQVNNGAIHFRTYQAKAPVDVYLAQLNATVNNLTNIRNETTPLLTTVDAKAMAMDQAPFEFHMNLNPFSYHPSFHMTARLLGLDVTKINELSLAYGDFDFKRGYFDLVIDVDAKHGAMSGYVKPLFRNLKVFSLKQDLKMDDPIQFFWTALVGGVTQILTNPPRDQFGTLIPFTADEVTETSPDILATIGNILRNAFVRAYLPKLQPGGEAGDAGNLQFSAPSIVSPGAEGEGTQ